MDALVGLIGGGPAAEAAAAALAGVGASVEPHGVDDVAGAGLDLAVVVDSVGAGTFESVGIDRWVAVETGGVGGHPLADVDAAVAALTPESAGYGDLCRRVASTVGETPGHQRASSDRSAVRLAGAVAGRRAVALLEGADLGGTVVEVSGADVGGGREFLAVPTGERDRTPRRDHRDASLDDSLARAERALDDRGRTRVVPAAVLPRGDGRHARVQRHPRRRVRRRR
jgi:ribosomal protein S12 methylthiotransferase accessory factor